MQSFFTKLNGNNKNPDSSTTKRRTTEIIAVSECWQDIQSKETSPVKATVLERRVDRDIMARCTGIIIAI